MKISELKGAQLDYWVAKADGKEAGIERHAIVDPDPIRNMWCILFKDGKPDFQNGLYRPSQEWSQGGPIIEREKIAVEPCRNPEAGSDWQAYFPVESHTSGWYSENLQVGSTPLLAAMRCFVLSRFPEIEEDQNGSCWE